MRRPFLLVGLTGGIATGKSTVSRMFQDLGCVVIDADVLAREVVQPGEPAHAPVVGEFGPGVVQADGTLDRKRLGAIVFADAEKRKRLEAITHPAIRARLADRLARLADESFRGIVIFDAPVMIESGNYRNMDRLVVVVTDEATQQARLLARDRSDAGQARMRIASQMPVVEKAKLADYVIDNAGDRTATLAETRRVFAALCAESRLGTKLMGYPAPLAVLFPVGMGVYGQNRIPPRAAIQSLRENPDGLEVLAYHARSSGNFVFRDARDARTAPASMTVTMGQRVVRLGCVARRYPELVRLEWSLPARASVNRGSVVIDDGNGHLQRVVAVMLSRDVAVERRAPGPLRPGIEVLSWVSPRDALCLYDRPSEGGSLGQVSRALVAASRRQGEGAPLVCTARAMGVIRDILCGELQAVRPTEGRSMKLAPRIVVDPKIHSGQPVIEGTRVPVHVVVGQVAAGMPIETVAEEYGLVREDVLAALAYAAHVVAGEEIRAID